MPPLPRSPFPESQITKLWRFVVRELAASPYLARVKTTEAWEGGAVSVLPVTLAELPALRVSPAAGAWKWADECRFDGPFILDVRIAVAGARASDLIDFWSAVAKAIRPTNELMTRLQPLGCYHLTPSAPAFRPRLICDGQAIEAEGQITLLTNVNI